MLSGAAWRDGITCLSVLARTSWMKSGAGTLRQDSASVYIHLLSENIRATLLLQTHIPSEHVVDICT